MVQCLHARLDPALQPRINGRRPLHYERGPDPLEDRPAHVRAASSVVRFHGDLFVVQDDALFVARIDDRNFSVSDLMLPKGFGDLRLFDDVRGNKSHKLDLEAAVVLPSARGEVLLAFGSGSTSKRERVVVLRGNESKMNVDVVDAPALYAAMRENGAFSGSELNIEGALSLGEDLVFFQRGNGAPVGDRLPIDATASVRAQDLLAYLEDGGPCPPLRDVRQYELGDVAGCRLTFTDATWYERRLIYVAAAEASPDATRDGPVAGVALGIIGEDGVRYGMLLDEKGEPSTDKVEGIVESTAGGLIGVVDRDDPDAPADLVHIEWTIPT